MSTSRPITSALSRTAFALVSFAVLTISHTSIFAADYPKIDVKEESLIANPDGATITLIYDLSKSRAIMKSIGAADREGFAKALSARVADFYLSSAAAEEVAQIKTATVVLVYVDKLDEYDRPDLSSLTELGTAKLNIEGGKAGGEIALSGPMEF